MSQNLRVEIRVRAIRGRTVRTRHWHGRLLRVRERELLTVRFEKEHEICSFSKHVRQRPTFPVGVLGIVHLNGAIRRSSFQSFVDPDECGHTCAYIRLSIRHGNLFVADLNYSENLPDNDHRGGIRELGDVREGKQSAVCKHREDKRSKQSNATPK